MMRAFAMAFTASVLLSISAATASAHFLWLAPESTAVGDVVRVYFAEEATPDDPTLLKYIKGMRAWQLRAGEVPTPLMLERSADALSVQLPENAIDGSLVIASHDFGVFERGDSVFRLKYYAKAGPPAGDRSWTEIDCTEQLQLDVVPTISDRKIHVSVLFDGKPAGGAQVVASGPGLEGFDGETDRDGNASILLAGAGRYSIRVRYVETTPGELEGKKYPEVRHYTTVTLDAQSGSSPAAVGDLPALEQPVTSFGAALLNGALYVYGGHTGSAHSYSHEEQDHVLRKLDLPAGKWEVVAEGPHLQGLALVAHASKLIRIGGFTAKNTTGEEHDLWSQASVASFDPQTKEWTDLPALPEPRSSFDAAVSGDTVYVIGGWKLAGKAENVWHKTAWAMDLSAEPLKWTALPQPPFLRRALAVAAHDGKIFAIGGMQQEGGPTTRVDIYDPRTKAWSQGPSLAAEESQSEPASDVGSSEPAGRRSMTGFGASAFATGGQLYVSTIDGNLQRLSDDGSKWIIVAKTPTARFFHRMLPVDESHFLIVGGANMSIGKFAELEVISVGR